MLHSFNAVSIVIPELFIRRSFGYPFLSKRPFTAILIWPSVFENEQTKSSLRLPRNRHLQESPKFHVSWQLLVTSQVLKAAASEWYAMTSVLARRSILSKYICRYSKHTHTKLAALHGTMPFSQWSMRVCVCIPQERWVQLRATQSCTVQFHLTSVIKSHCVAQHCLYWGVGEKKNPTQQAGSVLKKRLQKADEKTVIAQFTVRYPIHLSLPVTSHEEVQSIICCHRYSLVRCKKCFPACTNPFSCTHVKIQTLYLLLHCIYNSDSI